MKLKNTVLFDLEGVALRQQTDPTKPPKDDAPVVTLSRILINAALSPAQGQPYSPEQNAARYSAAVSLHGKDPDVELDIAQDTLAFLMKDVHRLYAPLVAGQAQKIVDG